MIDEFDGPDFEADRKAAAKWARELLKRDDVVVLDTETTGLDSSAEIVQIAIIDLAGSVLLDTLVKPVLSIPMQASRIHGITDETVTDAPNWSEVREQVEAIIHGKLVLIYNAEYDTRLIKQSDRALTWKSYDPEPEPIQLQALCVMQEYSRFVGDWNDYHGNYRWQRLPGGDHSALGDCRATLDVIKRMALIDTKYND